MIKLKDLTVKNFMSVGNQTQAVDFNKEQLTLVLGENLDQGGDDSGSRNGTGKTTIINALSYALYGSALTNIKRNNLINKTNSKAMLVTLHFEKNNIDKANENRIRSAMKSAESIYYTKKFNECLTWYRNHFNSGFIIVTDMEINSDLTYLLYDQEARSLNRVVTQAT